MGLVVFAVWALGSGMTATVGLPLLVVGSVVVMMCMLAFVSVLFAAYGLQDRTQALALPEGSIRAVIAMMLIVLFAILTIYLYGSIAAGTMHAVPNLTEAQRDQFIAQLGPGSAYWIADPQGGTFTVWFRQGATAAGNDFAKQLLVLVGTLVTSISSFYFGSRLAGEAGGGKPGGRRPPLSLRSVSPASYVRGSGAVDLTLEGDNLELVKDVKLLSGAAQIVATAVMSDANKATCQIDIGPTAPAGAWDVVVVDAEGNTAKLQAALSVQ